MKKIVMSVAMALLCGAAHAQQNAVVITQTNGTTVNCFFKEQPKVTYMGDALLLTTTDGTVQYSLRALRKFEFAHVDIPTAIDSPTALQDGLLLSFSGGQVALANAEAGQEVSLYDVNGQLMSRQTVDAAGRAALSMEALAKGTYIIQIGETTYKFLKP